MEKGDMPNDPLVDVIPEKAKVDPLHPSPFAWGCCVRAPGQPSLLSPQLSAFQNAGSASFGLPPKAPLGLPGQEGTTRMIPKPRGLPAWGPGLSRLV